MAERLLFLCHRIPYPPIKGDKIRSWQILRHLADRYDVHLGCLYDDPQDAAHIPFLRSLCADLCCQPLRPRVARLKSLAGFFANQPLTTGYFEDRGLRRWVERYSALHGVGRVLAFSSAMAPYVPGARDGSRRILDMVDVDSEKWGQYARSRRPPFRWIYQREARTLRALERRAAASFDATLLVSQAEAAVCRGLASPEAHDRVMVMENGVDTEFFSPDRKYPSPFAGFAPALVFTGAMDYWPNVQGVTWFADEVMPRLRELGLAVDLWIVGTSPTPAVMRLAETPDIHVTGRVPDVRPYLAHAAAVVAPLAIARGVQNKVLEAMAMARPIVATPAAREGIDAEDGRELIVAADAEGFAARIGSLLANGTGPMGERARRTAIDRYSWSRNLRLLEGLLEG